MKTYTFTVGVGEASVGIIPLGFVGEHLAREIVFDCTAFAEVYGPGTAQVIARLPDGRKYPVAVNKSGNLVHWVITAADVGVPGTGRVGLQWIVNHTIAKTRIFTTQIRRSLTGTDIDAPPDPYKDWMDQIMEAVTTYTHHQRLASSTWYIPHNLGKHPSVTVVDSGGTVVCGDITYLDDNAILIQFKGVFSGTAYLN